MVSSDSFLENIQFHTLDSRTDISSFSCSEPLLNEFLHDDALDDIDNLYSVTHIATYHNEVVGFFTLITDNISVDMIDKPNYTSYQHHKLPAVKIARLATDRRYERRGIGRLMLLQIFRLVNFISSLAGCRIITVDAKKDALGFYHKFSFREVNSKKERKYVPMYLDYKMLKEEQERESKE